jgi:hypothetical protein
MKLRNPMKLSETTVNLLKNFSSINQSILFKEGNKLRSISVMKNILAEATIEESFPKDFGIYDLNQFLNGLSLHASPELDFKSNDFVIVAPPEKAINLPTEDVCFVLTSQQLEKLKKAASIYQLPDISAVGEAGVIKLVARDKKNDTSNDFSIIVGETDQEFVFNFKEDNLKIVPGSYDVVVSQKLLSKFTNQNIDVTYFIALEPDSTFG